MCVNDVLTVIPYLLYIIERSVHVMSLVSIVQKINISSILFNGWSTLKQVKATSMTILTSSPCILKLNSSQLFSTNIEHFIFMIQRSKTKLPFQKTAIF